MGVNNDTPVSGAAYGIRPAGPLRTPEEYFYRLGLDTLQVSAQGTWFDPDGGSNLLRLRKDAEAKKAAGFGKATIDAPDGRELVVLPHGGRPSYQVLMRDGDGLEIRALPGSKMPPFIFRFGARWCVENDVDTLGAWMACLMRSVGFEPEAIKLSEVHIRCDAPVAFTEQDVKHVRGTGTRNGRLNLHTQKGVLSGINNVGGQKPLKFSIYDKRLEQLDNPSVVWPAVWANHGIPADSPIWRTESRWNRKALNLAGLDNLTDLTPQRLAGLWSIFSRRFLMFVEDPGQRTDRTEILPKWAAIQACGAPVDAAPIRAGVDITSTQLVKQAAGCVARAVAVAGTGHARSEIIRALTHVAETGRARFDAEWRVYIKEALEEALDKLTLEGFPTVSSLRLDLAQWIEKSLDKKNLAQPFAKLNTKLSGGEA
jgi:hypothetical protein